MTDFFKNIQSEHNKLNFDVYNLNTSICNAIRRIMISEIETLGFRFTFDDDSDIKILKNTSALHNEFLGHRLSLIPVIYPSNEIYSFAKDSLEFIIDEVNNTSNIIDITTKDIKILDTTTGKFLSETQTRNFFPPNPITNDYILINKLKPNKVEGSEGERMNVVMKADRGIGQEHARYTPTSVSVFINKMDDSKFELALKEKLSKQDESMSAAEIKSFSRSLRLAEGERHFMTDENGEPNVFEYKIESDGRIPPQIILHKSLFVLEEKLKKFQSNLSDEEIVTFNNSDCIMNSYDVLVKNEDYTLGYLIQHYVYELYQNTENNDVKYISTNVPHPLEDNLLFRISLENSVDKETSIVNIKKILSGTVDNILELITKLKVEMKGKFKNNL
jgi:DNA-directed RNA polymerase II subunit RPB3|uniref:DNA-directed RNA polymerase RpoA/D/Rpb3-type domain-containing protein n=1 Tax=Mimiviridae sp. ChoanoV1 TaxID=2596887 RepID=A0A5B8HX49_9VIRU|nr:hypothetical protein 1_155 [Mimiviridae sp. ChoanoV1]